RWLRQSHGTAYRLTTLTPTALAGGKLSRQRQVAEHITQGHRLQVARADQLEHLRVDLGDRRMIGMPEDQAFGEEPFSRLSQHLLSRQHRTVAEGPPPHHRPAEPEIATDSISSIVVVAVRRAQPVSRSRAWGGPGIAR